MSKIQSEILNSMYNKLRENEELEDKLIDELKSSLDNVDKPKVDDLVKIFLNPENIND